MGGRKTREGEKKTRTEPLELKLGGIQIKIHTAGEGGGVSGEPACTRNGKRRKWGSKGESVSWGQISQFWGRGEQVLAKIQKRETKGDGAVERRGGTKGEKGVKGFRRSTKNRYECAGGQLGKGGNLTDLNQGAPKGLRGERKTKEDDKREGIESKILGGEGKSKDYKTTRGQRGPTQTTKGESSVCLKKKKRNPLFKVKKKSRTKVNNTLGKKRTCSRGSKGRHFDKKGNATPLHAS